tara:strand:- start:1 stop:585 length:585 start_codon:yes stop_codon:yes gene_type:complete
MAFFNQTSFEPKRQFRFLVNFSKLGDGVTFMAKSVDKPSYDSTVSEHNVLNHVFKFPGVVKWADISVKFIDAVEPNVGSKFYNALRNSGYFVPDSPAGLVHGITKQGSNATLGEIEIQQLDGGGIVAPSDPGSGLGIQEIPVNVVDKWTLHNAFIKGIKWGSLDYGNEDLVEIELDLSYDYAAYEAGGLLKYNT